MYRGGSKSRYNTALVDRMCARLAAGESVRSICRRKGYPSRDTFFKWLRIHPEFKEAYIIAKEESADAMVEEMLDIADDGTNDWVENSDDETGKTAYKFNGEHYNRSRLRVDVRKWAASKLKPKKYGDKLMHQGDEDNPIATKNVTEVVLRPLQADDEDE